MRFDTSVQPNYESTDPFSDPRFESFETPTTFIAASSGQNESGMFELNFRDEQYLHTQPEKKAVSLKMKWLNI